MIWFIVISIVGYSLVRFFISLNKDNDDLQSQNLDEKFQIIVNMINNVAFNNNGSITTIDKREFNLYEEGSNQIIKFHYSTGHLTLTWRYKYFQKEIIHEMQYNEVRNLSIFEQQKLAQNFIDKAILKIEAHKHSVMSEL